MTDKIILNETSDKRSSIIHDATITLANLVFCRFRSSKILIVTTTAVAVNMIPIKRAVFNEYPNNNAIDIDAKNGNKAPTNAIPNDLRIAVMNSRGLVSTPVWSIIKNIPSWARISIISLGSINPKTAGPIIIPVINSPIMVGNPILRSNTAIDQITTIKMSNCLKMGMVNRKLIFDL
jgi:hypothetical protein